ncbi:MAG: DUF1624 domain-containing protein [Desulfobacteraceae bacterium]|nr:DUF1624 domain-containing protein [Desulfobacteraceae bacterium]
MKNNLTGSQRIEYIDFVRGIAILFMIWQHAMIFYAVDGGERSILGGIVLLLGTAPAAPVFMVIMGIFFMKAKNKGVLYGLVRGIKLLALGYILNCFRFFIPLTIGTLTGLKFPSPISANALLFSVDILQMAGLSLIIMALLRQFLPFKQLWVVIVVLIAFISPLIWGLFPSYPIVSLLWGEQAFVFFPLFPWVIYPIIGMYLHAPIFDEKNEYYFFFLFKIGVVLIIAGTVLWTSISNEIFVQGDYHRSGPAVHMVIIGFVFIWLFFCKSIFGKLRIDTLKNILFFWSKNVTIIYFIQWVLYGWGMLVFGWQSLDPVIALCIGWMVCVLSHFLTQGYLKKRGQIFT